MSRLPVLLIIYILTAATSVAYAQTPSGRHDNSSPWLSDTQEGPISASIEDKAALRVPKGYLFIGQTGTAEIAKAAHNIGDGKEYLLAPSNNEWEAYIEYENVGHITDSDHIDADALLESMRKSNKIGNQEKIKRGWPTMTIIGWAFRPRYDQENHRLEWAFKVRNDSTNALVVNYHTQLLGREGTTAVAVVTPVNNMNADVAQFKQVIKSFQYNPGHQYSQFTQGDKMAGYGLGALILGGATAVAAKKGLFAGLIAILVAGWKIVLVGLAAAGAWFRRIFKRKPGA